MGQLQGIQKDLEAIGYQVVAITQDKPEHIQKTVAKLKLGYGVYSDISMTFSSGMGLTFQIDAKTAEMFKSYNIDLVGLYGRSEPLMTVPAVFLIDGSGKIVFEHIDPDYRVRLAPEVILSAARATGKK